MKKILTLSLAMLLISSCAQRIGDFTIVSTKNVDIGDKYVRVATDVVGKDVAHIILGMLFKYPNLEEAVDDALRVHNGDLMTNAVIKWKGWNAIFYGQALYIVTGDVWVKSDDNASNNFEGSSVYTASDINGQIVLQDSNGNSQVVFDDNNTSFEDGNLINNTAKNIIKIN